MRSPRVLGRAGGSQPNMDNRTIKKPNSEPSSMIVGVLAVALLLGGTRWASYIGRPPVFVTDVLLFGGISQFLLADSRRRRSLPWVDRPRNKWLSTFILYVVFRGILSFTFEDISLWVRDLAPFAYAVLALLSARATERSDERGQRRTLNALLVAMTFHLGWTALAAITKNANGINWSFPGSPINIFGLRTDVDSAVVGILGAFALYRVISGQGRSAVNLTLLVVSSMTVLLLYSRAGLIAALGAYLLAYWLGLKNLQPLAKKKMLWAAAFPILVLSLGILVSLSEPGQRLLAGIGVVDPATGSQLNAQGTQGARISAWMMVIDYTSATPARFMFGVGFGPDFIQQSGAFPILAGTDYTGVRSPHNWFVGVFARMGLLGLFLAVGLVLAMIRRITLAADSISVSPLATLCVLTVAALLVAGCMGVVLESPFGAVPFWWSLGVISSAPISKSTIRRQIGETREYGMNLVTQEQR